MQELRKREDMTRRHQLRLPLLRGLALVAASVISQGCVSYNWVGPSAMAFENPQDLGQGRRSIEASRGRPPLSARFLEHTWGSPDSIEHLESGIERWTYYLGLPWNGVVLSALIMPIPLLVPVGREWVSFDIENGLVISASGEKDTSRCSALYGFYVGVCGSGFGSQVDTEPRLVIEGTYYTESFLAPQCSPFQPTPPYKTCAT
ncbi:MAG: hypothetical protein ACI9EF_002921 [Pseudohongiellaceae bacterium]|jgi:hypothetical protein